MKQRQSMKDNRVSMEISITFHQLMSLSVGNVDYGIDENVKASERYIEHTQ